MLITNTNFTEQEKGWLELILAYDFSGKEEIVQQINSAEVEREYTNFYLSVKFHVDKMEKPVKNNARIPIEARIYKKDKVPLQFLLHVIGGYAAELEIFYADSSFISEKLELDGANIEYIVNLP